MNYTKSILVAGAALVAMGSANADVITFEDQNGPSLFSQATPAPQTLVYPHAIFQGGVILTNASNLPADETTIYGTASFKSGLLNPITISFDHAVNNVFFDLLNGQNGNQNYVIADNNGHSATFNLTSNLTSGSTLVGFAATGNKVTISSTGSETFDFFIDNVHFDETLPPVLAPVPEPETYALMLAGLGVLGFAARRRKS